MDYEVVIGLEVHAQLLTESKIFCGCSTKFGAAPNTHTCPVCLGMPGVLPVLNRKVVEFTLRLALATHCQIARTSRFARKNYFYPDLPKGYQISQYELPVAEHGWLDIEINGETKRIGITRIHLEEDAGKLVHDESQSLSYVDFNRTGVPLIEVVSEPDLRTPEEASTYLKKLRDIVRYLDICDGNMEEGSLRCDANISLRPVGSEGFGVKTELKNMNSFRFVQRALEYEIKRQRAVLEQGGTIVQETRLWDSDKGVTHGMRGKEEAHDYRYFPDPDLVPVVVDDEWIENVRKELPELPDAKKARFIKEYGLPEQDAVILTGSKDLADFFEACTARFPQPKKVSNWIMVELLRVLKRDDKEIDQCPVTPEALADLLKMVDENVISGKIAKTVFEEMYVTGKAPELIVEEKGLKQVTDESEIARVIDGVLEAHPNEIEEYRAGKEKLFGFFIGQVMKQTSGKANPKIVNKILKEKLKD
ncbi:MAG: Asp-tRNA(Asn)/Glu-tRNA(Gln) amidotransferase subunit GatB [Deltaproteobacteria bacterium]|nr:MAG: Asp-tRNA(Asn)/Glu-tRNA(Gln) amidotransferase subunit GatB [Deltaproteobacteria bacterium]